MIRSNATDDVHNSAIATKILQHISRVRDNRDEMQARRFIWELIQNAKDAKYPNIPVRIKVELFEDRLTFAHTGRPFRVKNILSIINQVSSKLPDDEELSAKKFEILLDRSGGITHSDFDENWFENTVVSKIYGILMKYPIVSVKPLLYY